MSNSISTIKELREAYGFSYYQFKKILGKKFDELNLGYSSTITPMQIAEIEKILGNVPQAKK